MSAQKFEEFWASYPRKIAKKRALQVWTRLKPNEELFGIIMSAVEAHKKSKQWLKDGGDFIPHPATWLYQERWTDELPQAAPTKRKILDLDAVK